MLLYGMPNALAKLRASAVASGAVIFARYLNCQDAGRKTQLRIARKRWGVFVARAPLA